MVAKILKDLKIILFDMLNFNRVSKDKVQNSMDPLSSDGANTVEEWITGKDVCMEDYGNSDWMALDPPSSNTMLLGSASDEVEELVEGRYISLDVKYY